MINDNSTTNIKPSKPSWLKVKLPIGEEFTKVRNIVSEHKLHTICQSGNCPNMGECWGAGTATFMILGNVCTRSCGFCSVATGRPEAVDPFEPLRVAKSVKLLGWLKADADNNECRVLTNVRCLSEGVDVPSLDAVMFLAARNSQVDVVQSVGRVMRKAPGKNYGYIIIPVVVPSTVEADKALDDNERYKVVWTVLNALRAHDDRFNATVNKIELNKNRPTQILVGRPEYAWEDGKPVMSDTESPAYGATKDIGQQLAMQFEQLQHIVFARMVQKVGDRRYWEQWAKNVAEIAERQVGRINRLVKEDKTHQKAFASFLSGLQKNINPSITEQEAIEMLSQHIITKPVFEALFEGYSFVKNNPISVSMQTMLDLLLKI